MGSVVISGATSGAITLAVPAEAGTRTLTLPATTATVLTTDISAAGDTSAGDNAAVGYTAAEGLILTGQGSTSDVTIKNDADATVISIPTGTTNVGINTTAPGAQLEIDGGGSTATYLMTNDATAAAGGGGLNLSIDNSLDANLNNAKAGRIAFGTSNAERMRITTAGIVQIQAGSASPNGEFFRIGTNSVGSVPVMSASFPGNARWLFNTNDTAGQSGGRHHTYFSNGGEVGTVTTTTSATTYATSSDYRLKENVNYSWNATTRLKQLKPARFNFKVNADSEIVDGFLAHEVSSIVPEAVTGTKDGMRPEVLYVEGDELPDGKSVGDVKEASAPDYQGIDQSKLVPLLVKTIQELEARITALEA